MPLLGQCAAARAHGGSKERDLLDRALARNSTLPELGVPKSCASHAQPHLMEVLSVQLFGREASLGCGEEYQDLESAVPLRMALHTRTAVQRRVSSLVALLLAIISNIAEHGPRASSQLTHNQRRAARKIYSSTRAIKISLPGWASADEQLGLRLKPSIW